MTLIGLPALSGILLRRFASHPLVKGPPHFRAFCGAPLLDQGSHRIGSLELIHAKPRSVPQIYFSPVSNLPQLSWSMLAGKHLAAVSVLYRAIINCEACSI